MIEVLIRTRVVQVPHIYRFIECGAGTSRSLHGPDGGYLVDSHLLEIGQRTKVATESLTASAKYAFRQIRDVVRNGCLNAEYGTFFPRAICSCKLAPGSREFI